MRKFALIVLILCLGNLAEAQNLVPNGDFEIYTACPIPNNAFNTVSNWYGVSGTPDYLNSCAPVSSGMNVPYCGQGIYQPDCCGGYGYVGIIPFSYNVSTHNWREDIQCKLIDTLKAGHKYLASMYVSCGDYQNVAIVTMGMYFTPNAVNGGSSNFINQPNPQVKNHTLLKDTLNWMLVQDTFIAVGNEVYLTIGNFSTDSLSDTTYVGYSGQGGGLDAYYYVDGVSVYDVVTLGIKQVQEEKFTVYPNPASDKVYIEAKEEEFNGIIISDLLGKEVLSSKEKEMDVSALAEGIYFVTLTTSEGKLTKKIIVSH